MDKKIAIIQLAYNDKDNLEEGIGSLLEQNYPVWKHYLIDNNSSDNTFDLVKEKFSSVEAVRNNSNLGFAKANNIYIEKAFSEGADFCLIVNTDILANEDLLAKLVALHEDLSKNVQKVGLIQPAVLLYNHRNKINTTGNTIHYLGFGYCKDLNKEFNPDNKFNEVTFASGSCLLLSKEYYADIGMFDEEFFMYHEDLNLAWRGLLKGYKHYCNNEAIIYHKYNFTKGTYKMYHSEKNRLMVLLENYSIKTLTLLSPILIVNELLMIVYSLLNGWFKGKIDGYKFIFSNMNMIKTKRKLIQTSRTVSDKKLVYIFDSTLYFDALKNKIIDFVVNPIYSMYYYIIKLLI